MRFLHFANANAQMLLDQVKSYFLVSIGMGGFGAAVKPGARQRALTAWSKTPNENDQPIIMMNGTGKMCHPYIHN